jgi:hypothetical protein
MELIVSVFMTSALHSAGNSQDGRERRRWGLHWRVLAIKRHGNDLISQDMQDSVQKQPQDRRQQYANKGFTVKKWPL